MNEPMALSWLTITLICFPSNWDTTTAQPLTEQQKEQIKGVIENYNTAYLYRLGIFPVSLVLQKQLNESSDLQEKVSEERESDPQGLYPHYEDYVKTPVVSWNPMRAPFSLSLSLLGKPMSHEWAQYARHHMSPYIFGPSRIGGEMVRNLEHGYRAGYLYSMTTISMDSPTWAQWIFRSVNHVPTP